MFLLISAEGFFLEFRQVFLGCDGVGDIPEWIDLDIFQLVGKYGRCMIGLADDDAGGVNRLSILNDFEILVGQIHKNIEVAEIVGHPAAALHIEFHLDQLVFDRRVEDERACSFRPRHPFQRP